MQLGRSSGASSQDQWQLRLDISNGGSSSSSHGWRKTGLHTSANTGCTGRTQTWSCASSPPACGTCSLQGRAARCDRCGWSAPLSSGGSARQTARLAAIRRQQTAASVIRQFSHPWGSCLCRRGLGPRTCTGKRQRDWRLNRGMGWAAGRGDQEYRQAALEDGRAITARAAMTQGPWPPYSLAQVAHAHSGMWCVLPASQPTYRGQASSPALTCTGGTWATAE